MVVQSIANIKQGKCQHKYQLCQPKKMKTVFFSQITISHKLLRPQHLEALYLREERGKEQKNNLKPSQVYLEIKQHKTT